MRRRAPLSAGVVALVAVSASLLVTVAGSTCPNGCSCNENTLVVTCEEANLDVIPITLNPSIRELRLRSNRIETVNAAVFQFYIELRRIDLAHNNLVSIDESAFEHQRSLHELILNNNKISTVDHGSFAGLTNLTVLNLRGNLIVNLTRGMFKNMPRLQKLDLGNNRLSNIDPAAFQDLRSLSELYLDDNALRSIPSTALAPLSSLAELKLGLNLFVTLPDGAFERLVRLTALDLSGAGLSNVTEGAFRGLDGLRTLNLNNNKFNAIPTRQLVGLARLENLDIGSNNISVVPAGAFAGLSLLRSLKISGSVLEIVDPDAFRENLSLETLEISSNKRLATLPSGLLTGLPRLRHLSLRDNSLTDIPQDLAPWSELRTINLAENPLHCVCSLRWLRDVLVRKNETTALCASPLEVRDRALHEVPPDALGCTRHDTGQQAIIGIICGSALALLLVVSVALFRCRHRLHGMLKNYRWNKRAISRKEQEYQKTFSEDDFVVRVQDTKPVPVTEL